jgi:hypothetical protein
LFEKIRYLEENVVASSHLIHNSMNELERATSAAGTTLSNAVNAFNQLNYTKFLENVVEDIKEAQTNAKIERIANESRLEESMQSMLKDIDVQTEDEKLKFALELAVHQVTKDKGKKGEATEGEAEEDEQAKKDKKIANETK